MAKKNLVYNLTEPVGKNMPNQPDDVLLARFLLRRLSEVAKFGSPYKDLPIVPSFDSTLSDAIWWFQRFAKSQGKSITVDGRMDPAPKGDGKYTIMYLNGNYWKYYPQYRHYLEGDPLFPKMLSEQMNVYIPIYL